MIPVLAALCILRFAQMKSMLPNNITAGETAFLCSVFALGKAMAADKPDENSRIGKTASNLDALRYNCEVCRKRQQATFDGEVRTWT